MCILNEELEHYMELYHHLPLDVTRVREISFCKSPSLRLIGSTEQVELLSSRHSTSATAFKLCLIMSFPLVLGLCALSVNHSNSYLAYPGSTTVGEIALYDGNNLVGTEVTCDPQDNFPSAIHFSKPSAQFDSCSLWQRS